jgi:ASC-1-like (ASCH) protein
MKWKGKLINYLIEQLKEDAQWENTIEKLLVDSSVGIHLAIFNEPFLSLVYNREKKIESRFSINKRSPYEKVKKGDVIILKESGGLVTGVFVAGEVKFFHLTNRKSLEAIEANFGKAICADYDPNFWRDKAKSKYATLI